MAKHTCVPNPRTVDHFPAGDSRAPRHAERVAGQQQAAGHPEAHTHYDASRDAFTVVVSDGGAQ